MRPFVTKEAVARLLFLWYTNAREHFKYQVQELFGANKHSVLQQVGVPPVHVLFQKKQSPLPRPQLWCNQE